MFENWLRSLRSTRGSVAIQIGLMLVILMGMVALGTEIVYVLYKHREMQSAADAAALGAATALMTGSPSDFHTEAYAITATDGYTNGVKNVTVTIHNPPATGPYAGNNKAIEAIVSQPQTLGMISIFRSGVFDVGAHAVALIESSASYCILALDPSASAAVRVRNNAVVVNPNCGVAIDSSNASALWLDNNASINGPVHDHGGVYTDINGHLYGSPVETYSSVIADPYAARTMQTPPSCTSQSGTVANNATKNFSPGHFCSGWTFGNGVTINLAAGAYYIDTKLVLGNNNVIIGTGGVTLIINGDFAVNIANGAHLTLTAPSSGAYAGIAMFGRRNGLSTVTHIFSNNAVINIFGAVYFPNQIVDFQNNGAIGTGKCTQIIGRIVYILNNVALDNHCSGGVLPIGSDAARLVQ